jgi:hypothetical protein
MSRMGGVPAAAAAALRSGDGPTNAVLTDWL